MEIVKVGRTETFGMPRVATTYNLEGWELDLIGGTESEKAKIRDAYDAEKRDPKKWKEKFAEIHTPLERLSPFIDYFLGSMPGYQMFFNKYSLRTGFTEGFSISLNPVTITRLEDLLTPNQEKSPIEVRAIPSFHMSYPNLPLIECWAHLDFLGEKQDCTQIGSKIYSLLGEMLFEKYGHTDGISNPLIESGGMLTLASAHHAPRVLEDMIMFAQKSDSDSLKDLVETREALVYQYDKKSVTFRALKERYTRLLRKAINPEIGNN